MTAPEEGFEVEIFAEVADGEAILESVVEGNSAQIADPAFAAELRDWIRLTPDQSATSMVRGRLRGRRRNPSGHDNQSCGARGHPLHSTI